jgi:surfeit locus 1 family protein
MAHIVVVVVAIACLSLGFWQLRRLDERKLENAVGAARFEAVPEDLELLLSSVGADLDSLRYRRAVAIGRYAPEDEVLVRSQVYLGSAGFHVITPLVLNDGRAVLVNRGWVPLVIDQVPVSQAPPPPGVGEVSGWLGLTETRSGFGPDDPQEGRLVAMSRVDIARIQRQVPYELVPVQLTLADASENDLPIPADLPRFDDEGPHLGYAIQWFGFVVVGVVGYAFLIRSALATSPNPRPPQSDQGTPAPAGRV